MKIILFIFHVGIIFYFYPLDDLLALVGHFLITFTHMNILDHLLCYCQICCSSLTDFLPSFCC